ncbi:hypothetical protein ACCO45_009344 [Purpureocillium lilacinum]|uniref:Uncharacterized protein n=1 Tax=Purpureocillium lilacinum TaxID=33203 RepID=A0ACC4DMG9_PURLI
MRGDYEHSFFLKRRADTFSKGDVRELRTIIRTLSRSFEHVMSWNGAKYRVVREHQDSRPPTSEVSEATAAWIRLFNFEAPKEVLLSDLLPKVAHSGSCEHAPGAVDYHLSLRLFREQSEKWHDIAKRYVGLSTDAVKSFIMAALKYVFGADKQGLDAVVAELVQPHFRRLEPDLDRKLDELVRHYHHGQMICADQEFQWRLESVRRRRVQSEAQLGSTASSETSSSAEHATAGSQFDVVDMMKAYYLTSMQTFINNVIILAVEMCLVASIPSIVQPILENKLDAETILRLTERPSTVTKDQTRLSREVQVLEQALSICRDAKPWCQTSFPPVTLPQKIQKQHVSPSETPRNSPASASPPHQSTTPASKKVSATSSSRPSKTETESVTPKTIPAASAPVPQKGGSWHGGGFATATPGQSPCRQSAPSSSASSSVVAPYSGFGRPSTQPPAFGLSPSTPPSAPVRTSGGMFGSQENQQYSGNPRRRGGRGPADSTSYLVPSSSYREFSANYETLIMREGGSSTLTDRFVNICFAEKFRDFCPEELRLADYQSGIVSK